MPLSPHINPVSSAYNTGDDKSSFFAQSKKPIFSSFFCASPLKFETVALHRGRPIWFLKKSSNSGQWYQLEY